MGATFENFCKGLAFMKINLENTPLPLLVEPCGFITRQNDITYCISCNCIAY